MTLFLPRTLPHLMNINMLRAGDHVRVYPRNNISKERLEKFIGHLSRNLKIGDQIYVTLAREDLKSDLKVHLPLLNNAIDSLQPLRRFFEQEGAVNGPISMEACNDLAKIASNGRQKFLLGELAKDKDQ